MYEQIVLKSGLRILLVPRQDIKSITSMVFVGAGSRYEDREINGLSHFLEHMFFKGTKRRPTSLQISEEVDSVGGEFNAGTSKEYTVYYVRAASEHLPMSLDILSDMMINSKFDPKELENEKGVILEELKMYEDMPMRDVEDIYEMTLFGDQPLGWKTIGTRDAVLATTRDKMVKFKNALYTLDNMIVGIAGNFDRDQVVEQVEKFFAGIPVKRKTTWDRYKPQLQKTPVFKFVPKQTEQAHLVLGLRGFKRGDKDEYAAKVMSVILGANMSSRLFIELREKHKLCYYVRSSLSLYHDAGSLDIQAGVDLTRIPLAVRSIIKQLKKMATTKVSAKELNKAKQYMRGKLVLAMEDSSSMMEWFGMQQLLRGKITDLPDILKLIDKVTIEDVQAVSQRLFVDDRLNLVLIGPEKAVDEKTLKKVLTFGK